MFDLKKKEKLKYLKNKSITNSSLYINYIINFKKKKKI
jgi:hypothetical protein